jgi:tetratricopeptide (TPR) repeat protein
MNRLQLYLFVGRHEGVLWLSGVLARKRYFGPARRVCRVAAWLWRDQALLYRLEVAGLYLKEGSIPAAISESRRLAQDDPSEPSYYYLMGIAEERAGQTADAIASYRTAFAPGLFAPGFVADLRLRIGTLERELADDR